MDSRIASLGEVFQLGYVVPDLSAALDFWTRGLGVGPFFTIPKVEDLVTKLEYYGEPSDIRFSATLGYWGDRQIEIIVPTNDAPSIYRDWLRPGRRGLHHVCIEVEDLEPGRRLARDAGHAVAQEVAIAGGGGAIYVDMGEGAQVRYIELYQFAPGQKEIFTRMQAVARNWDGCDPLRPLLWDA
jgi:methylmalonyl-CoA/ethylmalonyl-CoA epimerase